MLQLPKQWYNIAIQDGVQDDRQNNDLTITTIIRTNLDTYFSVNLVILLTHYNQLIVLYT